MNALMTLRTVLKTCNTQDVEVVVIIGRVVSANRQVRRKRSLCVAFPTKGSTIRTCNVVVVLALVLRVLEIRLAMLTSLCLVISTPSLWSHSNSSSICASLLPEDLQSA